MADLTMNPSYGVCDRTFQWLSAVIGAVNAEVLLRFVRTRSTVKELVVEFRERKLAGWTTPEQVSSNIFFAMTEAASTISQVLDAAKATPLDSETELHTKCLFGEAVRGAIDSAPIKACKSCGAKYNGHYCISMFKMLIAQRLDGYIESVAGPFSGTSYDDTLLSKTPNFLSDVGGMYLGDHHFSMESHIINPPTNFEIHNLEDSEEQEEKIHDAAHVGFLRARVEHTFGRSQLHRFTRLLDIGVPGRSSFFLLL